MLFYYNCSDLKWKEGREKKEERIKTSHPTT